MFVARITFRHSKDYVTLLKNLSDLQEASNSNILRNYYCLDELKTEILS